MSGRPSDAVRLQKIISEHNNGITAGEVAKLLDTSSGRAGRLLYKMYKDGKVTRSMRLGTYHTRVYTPAEVSV